MLRRVMGMTAVFCLAMLAGGAQAAGLGRLTVLSALGKPLQAELEISATPEELLSLSAQIASAEVFAQKGLERSSGVASIQFSLEKRKDGTPFLRAVSDKPIQSPSVNLLVELNWAAGRVLREYTFLLDPPEASKASASPPETATLSIAYVVKRGDTLGEIAHETRPEGVHLNQVLVALFNANREAFDGENMNRIQAGKTLNIPDAETIRAVDPSEARKIIVAQAREFDAYRGILATTVAASTPAMPEAVPQQSATGKVMPKVEAPPPVGGDKLTISRSEMVKPDAPARAAALEEDLVAREKELKEASGRVTKLEKTVDDLKQLADLKEQPAVSAAPAAPVVSPAPTVTTQTSLPASKPTAGVMAGVMAGIMHPVALGSTAVVLLLALGWTVWRRRSKDRNAVTLAAPLGNSMDEETMDEEAMDEEIPVDEEPSYVMPPMPVDEPEPIPAMPLVEPEKTDWTPVEPSSKWESSPVMEPVTEPETTDWTPTGPSSKWESSPESPPIVPDRALDMALEFDPKPLPEPSLSPVSDIEWQPSRKEIPPLDFAGIDLDREEPEPRPGEIDEPEVTTKLELAQAYEEMGDLEGARELLKEVLNEGSRRQREAAETKLLHLGDA